MRGVPDRAVPVLELTVPEMLADPIVQKVMDYDGVTGQEVEDLVRTARLRFSDRESGNGQRNSDPKEMNRQHGGDVMSDRNCLCVTCACAADSDVKAAAGMRGVNHNHARLPALLRYRGMESEAVIAARLCKVESLIWSLQSVLNDLDVAIVTPVDSGVGAEAAADIGEPGRDAPAFAWRQLRILEQIFESALSRLRTGKSGSGEHTEPGTDRHFSSQAHDMNRGPDWESACAEGW